VGRLYSVSFTPAADLSVLSGIHAVLLLQSDRRNLLAARVSGLPVLAVEASDAGTDGNGRTEVRIAMDPKLPACLRGQHTDTTEPGAEGARLVPETGEAVLAFNNGSPCWVRSTEPGPSLYRSGLALPELGEGEPLMRHFRPESYLRILPLLHFVHELQNPEPRDSGPIRACFVFDDPNLTRKRFGCLDFDQLAAHSRSHQYHAAIAMVPLDTRRTGAEAVHWFREQPQHLSLLIHGNDHTRLELLRDIRAEDRLLMLAEALRRIGDFESRHGVQVDRVMEAPHGVLSWETFPALAGFGFEAVLVTPEHLIQYQPTAPWPSTFGMDMAEPTPSGIAGIPRIRMLPNWRLASVLAVFLGQPVVIAGHHQDAVDGLEFLEHIAGFLAGMGPVRWCPIREIARSNYKRCRTGPHLRVRSYQRRVRVPIPPGVTSISIERVWMNADEEEMVTVLAEDGLDLFNGLAGRCTPTISIPPTGLVEVWSLARAVLDPNRFPTSRAKFWPVVRRVLTELRDRTYPIRHPRRRRFEFPPSQSI